MKLGNCYDMAFEFLSQNQHWTLVHGIPTLTGGKFKGAKYGHAWSEYGDMVFDALSGKCILASVYYDLGKITYTKRYSYFKAIRLREEMKHSGPWDSRIQKTLHNGEKNG